MFWCSAMNLDCLHLRFAGGRMNVDQSQGRESEDPQTLKQTRSAVVFVSFMVYSWRDFGRALTSWKIQYRPRVPPPHVQSVAGWKPADSWSFWNEFSD